ncbi:MAG: hypothetical protein GY755_00935 [Chloroflexi bacterium]|nr:hypothetical protein [Chloroflexota bacterium]
MAKRTWEFSISGKKHIAEIKHAYWTGKKRIWLDGKIIVENRKLVATSESIFSIENTLCELGITTNGFTYSYYLLVDGVYIPAIGKRTSPSKVPPPKVVA